MTSTRTQQKTAVDQAAPSELTRRRGEILASYLEELGLGEGSAERARELPPSIEAGGYILELDEWERMVVSAYRSGRDAKGRPWPGLVAEGLAYQLRCLERVATTDGTSVPPPERQAELIDQLIIDGAVGITLLDDLQWAINRLIREGQLRVAGRLTDFRNAVNQNVSMIRSFLGGEIFACSESVARQSRDGQLQKRWPDIPAETADEIRPASPAPDHHRSPQPRPRPPVAGRVPVLRRIQKPSRSRAWLLSIVLAISLMVWASVAPRHAEPESFPRLTVQDFAHIPSVSKIEAPPPSLYVTISALRWREMSDLERWQVLEQIGTIAGRADYIGVHVRTSDGQTVGQWSRFNGSKVIKGPRGAS